MLLQISFLELTDKIFLCSIFGIIGVGVRDFPSNIAEFTEIGFSLSWGTIILANLLSLFRIFNYLAFPIFVYNILDDLLKRIMDDGQLMATLRGFLFELNKKNFKFATIKTTIKLLYKL